MLFMEKLMLGLLLWISVHIIVLVLYNRYRRKQLLLYFEICRGQELSERHFKNLMATYTSFLGFAMLPPSRTDYPKLYTNTEFNAFVNRSKSVLAYLLTAIILGFVLASMIDSFKR
jgi:preprotein translocase subunit SecG